MRSFLNQLESDRVTKLCSVADSDEKLFWKLLKGQKSSSQMSAFLVKGSLITDINEIRNMWADHFEALGTPSESATYDNGFAAQVSAHVKETFEACLDDPGEILNEPLIEVSFFTGRGGLWKFFKFCKFLVIPLLYE